MTKPHATALPDAAAGERLPAMLRKAFGYQGDHMHLPIADLDAALPFYENVSSRPPGTPSSL